MRQWEIKRPQVPVSFMLPTGTVPVILRPSAYPIKLDQYVPAMFVPFAEQSPDFARAIARGEIAEYIAPVIQLKPAVAPVVIEPVVEPTPIEVKVAVVDPEPTVEAPVELQPPLAELTTALEEVAEEPTSSVAAAPVLVAGEKPDQSWSIEQLTVYLRDNQIQAPQSMKKPAILRAIANHSVQE